MVRCLENFCFLMSRKEIMSKDAHATSKAAQRNTLQGRAGFLTRHCLPGELWHHASPRGQRRMPWALRTRQRGTGSASLWLGLRWRTEVTRTA
jgi:hypothetical protein